MRKITREACNALINKYKYYNSNTIVFNDQGIWRMMLHGNCIAKHTKDWGICISHRGYTTHTTKERLNGLVKIYQKNYQWYVKNPLKKIDVPWTGDWYSIRDFDYLEELDNRKQLLESNVLDKFKNKLEEQLFR